jgi:hypothetical protein
MKAEIDTDTFFKTVSVIGMTYGSGLSAAQGASARQSTDRGSFSPKRL